MRNLLKNKFFYIFILLSLIVGILIGLPFNLQSASFSFTIELIDIITIIVTIFLAIYITGALERRVQDDRIEKELHIALIEKLEKSLTEIEDEIKSENIKYKYIVSTVAKFRIKKNNLKKSLEDTFPQSSKILNSEIDNISILIESLKRLLTESSIDPNENKEAIVSDNIVTYSPSRLTSIDKKLNELENKLFRLKIQLNRL